MSVASFARCCGIHGPVQLANGQHILAKGGGKLKASDAPADGEGSVDQVCSISSKQHAKYNPHVDIGRMYSSARKLQLFTCQRNELP